MLAMQSHTSGTESVIIHSARVSVASNLAQLISTASVAYSSINGSYAYNNVNTTDPAAIAALAQPFRPSDIDLISTNQGPRVFFNTLTVVMTMLSQFFFVMALNGVHSSFQLFTRLPVSHNLRMRWGSSLIYTCVMGITLAGLVWAFKENWHIRNSAWAETWLLVWFTCHINFLVLDTATGFLPQSFISFFVITWVLINVTSTIAPFEIAPGFYKWLYAAPSHEYWGHADHNLV